MDNQPLQPAPVQPPQDPPTPGVPVYPAPPVMAAPLSPSPLPVAPNPLPVPAQVQPVEPPPPTPEPDFEEDEDEADGFDEQDDDAPLLQWETSEPATTTRSSFWYVIMALIAASIIIIAIVTQAWIFIPLGILIPIALTMYGNKGPGSHRYSLEPYGVRVDAKDYSYESFKAFFVIEDNGQAVFELIPLQRLGTLVTLHADQNTSQEVLGILASVLPETEPQGYLGESIFKKLKF